MEHAKHIIRALLLIFFFIGCFEIFRQSRLPESYGVLGNFRADAIKEMQEHPPVFSDPGSCQSCHAEQSAAVLAGKHNVIECQMCHAPLGGHVQNEEKISDMPMNRDPAWCLRCHEKLSARPETMKQIVLSQHMEEHDVEDMHKEGACLECHTVHEPDL